MEALKTRPTESKGDSRNCPHGVRWVVNTATGRVERARCLACEREPALAS